MLKAIIFDFDGVLVDSEPLHFQAFLQAASAIGYHMTYDDYLQTFIGLDDRDSFRVMLTGKPHPGSAQTEQHVAQLTRDKQTAFAELVGQGAAMIQGVWRLVDAYTGKIPLAIASGATKADITLILDKLDRREPFEVIVSADDVARSKPDPETYALAASELIRRYPDLNLTPADCLAIEDTAAGLHAAKAAGLKTLALTTTTPASRLAHADHILHNPDDLSPESLQAWFA